MPQENPNDTIRLDFEAEEHQAAHQQLIADSLMDEQVIYSLALLGW
jgi:hypothetical protein